jgi:hypothetical protein
VLALTVRACHPEDEADAFTGVDVRRLSLTFPLP